MTEVGVMPWWVGLIVGLTTWVLLPALVSAVARWRYRRDVQWLQHFASMYVQGRIDGRNEVLKTEIFPGTITGSSRPVFDK